MPRWIQSHRSSGVLVITEMLNAMFQAWNTQTLVKCGWSVVIHSLSSLAS